MKKLIFVIFGTKVWYVFHRTITMLQRAAITLTKLSTAQPQIRGMCSLAGSKTHENLKSAFAAEAMVACG